MGKRRKSRSTRVKERTRLIDPGPDEGGRYAPSPLLLQHGHQVEVAPKELRSTPDSSFPKRITTQRVIDRYRIHGHVSEREWKAADSIWRFWCDSGLDVRMAAGYDPDAVSSGRSSTDGMVATRIDGAIWLVNLFEAIPYRSRGVVRAVVIEDKLASDWARQRGFRGRDSERHGLERLSQGLRVLADKWSY